MADKSRADAREVVDRCRSESAADHPKLRWDRHLGSESLLACEVEYRQVVQREAQCWALVVKLFAEISSSTSAATFANRELPNWVDGKKERVAVKLNLQSSANLSPFDNRSSRFQLCLSTELSIFMCSKFFFTGSDPPSRHLNLVHPLKVQRGRQPITAVLGAAFGRKLLEAGSARKSQGGTWAATDIINNFQTLGSSPKPSSNPQPPLESRQCCACMSCPSYNKST